MKTPSIAVFDAHVDSIMPQERDNPFLGTNEIAESFIENLSYGTVYPSFGNPKAWYHIPSLVRERQDVTNNPGRTMTLGQRNICSGICIRLKSIGFMFAPIHLQRKPGIMPPGLNGVKNIHPPLGLD
jgi:hypothetical protein